MDRPERSRKKERADTWGGFAGVDRGGLAGSNSTAASLQIFGVSATLFDNPDLAAYVQKAAHLVPHPTSPAVMMDRFDVRLLLLEGVEKGAGGGGSNYCGGDLEMDENEEELERERYKDLVEKERMEEEEAEPERQRIGGAAIPYDYGNEGMGAQGFAESHAEASVATDQPFVPNFPVPDHLLEALPASEKLNKLILQTARFVREAGGQVEIVLRVKQGDNPNFSFLLPDDRLFPYYRWMVEEGLPMEEKKDVRPQSKSPQQQTSHQQDTPWSTAPNLPVETLDRSNSTPNALELLRTYSSFEDRPSSPPSSPSSHFPDEAKPVEKVQASLHSVDQGFPDPLASTCVNEQRLSTPQDGLPGGDHDVVPAVQKLASFCGTGPQTEALIEVNGSPEPGVPGVDDISEAESSEAELGAETKAIMEKLVTFIQRNGARFERVVRKRENMNPKFGFMLPWHSHHSAYRKRLTKAVGTRIAAEIFSFWGMGEGVNTQGADNQPLSELPLPHDDVGVGGDGSSQEPAPNALALEGDKGNAAGLISTATACERDGGKRGPDHLEDDDVYVSSIEDDGHQVSMIKANPSFGMTVARRESPECSSDAQRQQSSSETDGKECHSMEDVPRTGTESTEDILDAVEHSSHRNDGFSTRINEVLPAGGKEMSAAEKMAQRRLKARMLLEKDKAKKIEFEVAHRTQKARVVLDHRHAFLADEDEGGSKPGEVSTVESEQQTAGTGAPNAMGPLSELPALTEVVSAAAEHAKKHQEAFVATLRDPSQVLTKLERAHSPAVEFSEKAGNESMVNRSQNKAKHSTKSPKRSKKRCRSRDGRVSGSSKHHKRSVRHEKHKKHRRKERRSHKRKSASPTPSDISGSESAPDREDSTVLKNLRRKLKQLPDGV